MGMLLKVGRLPYNDHHHHPHFNVHFLPKLIKGVWTAAFQQYKVDNQPLVTIRQLSIHGNVGLSFC